MSFVACCSESKGKEKEQVNRTCVDAIVTLPSLSSKIPDSKCSTKIGAIVDDMSQSIAPGANNFPAV